MPRQTKLKSFRFFMFLIFTAMLAINDTQANKLPESHLVIHLDQGDKKINRNIYGHFAEHLGHCIYEGIWVGEDSPIPNTRGIRNDVVKALKRIKVPVLRWPGGCFADTYHWKDGIGPREDRPSIVNIFWGGVTENNHFGTHEFLDLCEQVGCEAFISVNVGSGSVREAAEWVEYVNFSGKSPMTDLRKKNGRDKPWKVKFWGLGNETMACGGHMFPDYYSHIYRQFNTYMRDYPDSEIYRIAAGAYEDVEFKWMETCMKMIGEHMNGIGLHQYTWNDGKRAIDFDENEWYRLIRNALSIEGYIQGNITIMDKYDPDKNIGLLIDEWGVWHGVESGTNERFLHQQNTLRDAMIAAVHFHIFHEFSDRIHMANIAQTVNVLQAMILTKDEKMILTPTYHVFDMYKDHQDATLLSFSLKTNEIEVAENKDREYEEDEEDLMKPFKKDRIPQLSATCTKDTNGNITISICNLDLEDSVKLTCEFRGGNIKNASAKILTSNDMRAHNTFKKPKNIKPVIFKDYKIKNKSLTMTLPSKSIVTYKIQ